MPRKNITPINRKTLDGPLRTIERKAERRGRKRKNISLARVQKMFQSGCLVSEVCADQGVSAPTLSEFIQVQVGMLPEEFRQHCHCQGNVALREAQFEKALKGDNTMMIFLGKDRLGQSDRRDLNLHVDIMADFVNRESRSLINQGESLAAFEDRLLEGA